LSPGVLQGTAGLLARPRFAAISWLYRLKLVVAGMNVRALGIASVVMALGLVTVPASADSLDVLGQVGVLGEWELTGNLAASGAGRKEFAGPVTMTHVGLCTQDGPEVKKGELRVQLASATRIRATLVVAGVTCTYQGLKSDAYKGMMRCPDQRDQPVMIWLK
jgi:hypothetical protein